MNPIDTLERELLLAAQRRTTRSRIPRRVLLLAAALGSLVAAILPVAFATGLVNSVFPPAHDTPHALGHGYVVATGTTSVGERWSFQLTRGFRFRNGTHADHGWALLVGDTSDPHRIHGIAVGGGPGPKRGAPGGGTVGYMRPISSRDPRTMYVADVPRSVALVRITFRSGKSLRVRPLRVDQARARATGTPYPYSFVAVAYSSRDMPRTVTYKDATGHDVTPSHGLVFPHRSTPRGAGGPVVQSPAL
jgi:hypothetical protein